MRTPLDCPPVYTKPLRYGAWGGSGGWGGLWAAAVAPNCSEAHGTVPAPAGIDIKQMGSDALSEGAGRREA